MMTKKDEKILKDAEKDNIPVFVFTAKDSLSIEALREYSEVCSLLGCERKHIEGIYERIKEFIAWQDNHPDKVKLPD